MSLSRRDFTVLAGAAVAASALPNASRAASAAIEMPPGAVDCHNHVMGSLAKYPYTAERAYTPPEANVAQLRALRTQVHTARNVLVTPSVYGIDNRCMVDALTELQGTARASRCCAGCFGCRTEAFGCCGRAWNPYRSWAV